MAAPLLPAASSARSGPAGAKRLKVLLAEDNVVNQKLALIVLRRLGCEVTVVADGRAARDAALGTKFDVVFMDCQMPEMDGYEASRAIRAAESGRRTPIVALTANAMADDRQKCMDAGMDDHLTKPLDIERLREFLDALRSVTRPTARATRAAKG